WTYVDCGASYHLATGLADLPSFRMLPKSFEISPDPPYPGKDLTVTAKGQAVRRIEDGAHAEVLVKLGVVKLINK
ncbi:hypothetical protein B0H13DRAFT_1548067, partial [Mycena leptocephala]